MDYHFQGIAIFRPDTNIFSSSSNCKIRTKCKALKSAKKMTFCTWNTRFISSILNILFEIAPLLSFQIMTYFHKGKNFKIWENILYSDNLESMTFYCYNKLMNYLKWICDLCYCYNNRISNYLFENDAKYKMNDIISINYIEPQKQVFYCN